MANEYTKQRSQINREPIDLMALVQDYIRYTISYWFLLVLLLAAAVGSALVYRYVNFKSEYRAIASYSLTSTNSIYTDAVVAGRLSGSVSAIVGTNTFREELMDILGKERMEGEWKITSSYTESANLFNLIVTSTDSEETNEILRAVEEIYPSWASRSIEYVTLTLLDEELSDGKAINVFSRNMLIAKALLIGIVIWFGILTVISLSRKTVLTEEHMKKISGTLPCIGIIPEIITRKRGKSSRFQLLLNNKHLDFAFSQLIQSARAHTEQILDKEQKKVLLITSTLPEEGKSMAAVNLALSWAGSGKKTLLIDGDMRRFGISRILSLPENSKGLWDLFCGSSKDEKDVSKILRKWNDISVLPSGTNRGEASTVIDDIRMKQIIDQLRDQFDVIIIDSSPSGLFADAAVYVKYADAVLYVVRHDYAYQAEIEKGMYPLMQTGKVIGYLLNRKKRGYSGYRDYGSYGYALYDSSGYGRYGYSRYSRYGRYGHYDYENDKKQG